MGEVRKKILLCFLASLGCFSVACAQQNRVFDSERVRSLRLVVDDDPLLPPVVRLNGRQAMELSFDVMTHTPERLIYHIFHCDYQWKHDGSESIFESDYLSGNNGRPIDNYETSFNTNQNYTHYSLRFPNQDVRILLSGNYAIEVFREEDYDGERSQNPLLRAEFCVAEPGMNIQAEVSGNTDIDFNQSHQQLSFHVQYGNLRVVNPERELHAVVMQNRRQDNAVVDLQPNQRMASGAAFTHRKELIFRGGNEYHKFETIDLHRPSMGVEQLQWFAPYYHATLVADVPQRSYTYDEDQNGISILRNAEHDDEHITSEYLWVHFTLRSPQALPDGDVYVCGLWTNGTWDPECRMEYDPLAGEYRAAVLLKQGYFSYQLRQRMASGVGRTLLTDGDFSETENEYTIYIYYRAQGGRYDRLVGYRTLTAKQ